MEVYPCALLSNIDIEPNFRRAVSTRKRNDSGLIVSAQQNPSIQD
jgi:hypothetical protein